MTKNKLAPRKMMAENGEEFDSTDSLVEDPDTENEGIADMEDIDIEGNPETAPPLVTDAVYVPSSFEPPVKNVRVCPNCNHRCFVGGTWYDFKKGVYQNVPEEIKSIMLNAGLLSPL